MKRKFIVWMLFLVLIPVLLIPTQANTPQVVDNAHLLTSQEVVLLEEKAEALMTRYGMDVVILTVESLDGISAQNTADDFYDYSGYGDDGVLFLLAMEEREWYISTCGDAIYALTDYGIQQLGIVTLPYLSVGDYSGAFELFLNELPIYFDALEDDSPIDGYADYSDDYYHGDQDYVEYFESGSKVSFGIALLIGIVAGGVTVLVMKASMNTKRKQRSAQDYIKQGSYKLHTRQDIFLYSRVAKTRRQENSSGGSSGGGSSVHTSSSGRSHGGGGGKF